MDIQKFTQKSIETIQKAQNLAIEHENSQIDQEHLLYALLIGENSLIKELLKKMNVSEEFERTIKKEIDNKPSMHSNARQMNQVYISRDVDEALTTAENTAEKMKDEYQQESNSNNQIDINQFINDKQETLNNLDNSINFPSSGFSIPTMPFSSSPSTPFAESL